ncbi:hypothetical protein JXA80_06675 [bacterium]|nr:hypothetical protein [candidate division CSSED10-310 bacterium]
MCFRIHVIAVLLGICVVFTGGLGVVSASSGAGAIEMFGFVQEGDEGALILEGSLEGYDAVIVTSTASDSMLISFGPVAPPENLKNHVFCDLKWFSVKVDGLTSVLDTGIVLEGMTGKTSKGWQYERLGLWHWTVEYDFEIAMEFGPKAAGCYTIGRCGSGPRIWGPFCDPCEWTLCCYGNHGYIVCGELLCQ